MKQVLFVLLFIIVSFVCYSQDYLGYSKNEVYAAIKVNFPNAEITEGINKKGYPYTKVDQIFNVYTYFYTEDTCSSYLICLPPNFLQKMVDLLSENLTQIDENIWVGEGKEYELNLVNRDLVTLLVRYEE